MGWNCPECGTLLHPLHLTGWPGDGREYFGRYEIRPYLCPECGAAYLTVFDPRATEGETYVGLLKLDAQKAGIRGGIRGARP